VTDKDLKAYNARQKEIMDEKTKPGSWIDINQILPDRNKQVLIRDKWNEVYLGRVWIESKKVKRKVEKDGWFKYEEELVPEFKMTCDGDFDFSVNDPKNTITHWASIPTC
jgi:hypothetical protein